MFIGEIPHRGPICVNLSNNFADIFIHGLKTRTERQGPRDLKN